MNDIDDTGTYLDDRVRELHAALDRTDAHSAMQALGDIRRAVRPDHTGNLGRLGDHDVESLSGNRESTYKLTLIAITIVLFAGALIAILAS
ncbi:hypothetical protein [Nocardia nova]|uniref:hypothetical protein n=1 Tax=Nocardia nova TaxID=37330 RepID=UPI0033EE38B3